MLGKKNLKNRSKQHGKGSFCRRGYRKKKEQAQSLLEYLSLIGIIVAILIAMTTHMQRGIQLMVKVMADQLGQQNMADQKMDSPTGYLKNSITISQSRLDKETKELPGLLNYIFHDRTHSETMTVLNGGITSNAN